MKCCECYLLIFEYITELQSVRNEMHQSYIVFLLFRMYACMIMCFENVRICMTYNHSKYN